MKKIFTLFCILFSAVLFAQKEITCQKGRIFMNDSLITTQKAKYMLLANKEAYHEFKTANRKNTWGGILVGAGSVLMASDLVRNLVSKNATYPSAATYAGVACIVVAIPILIGREKKYKKAVDLYNTSLKNTSQETNYNLQVVANQNGCGLKLNF